MSFLEEAKSEKERRSEEELRLSRWMGEAQKGDSESYRMLLAELDKMLTQYAMRAVKRSSPESNAAIARDITQEVLLAIHNKRHTYDPARRFLPWVFGIARHKLVDWQRKHFSESRVIDLSFEIDDVMAPSLAPGGAPANEQSSGSLQPLLDRLNPKQREVLELTKIQGLSVAETAQRTGLSQANVKVLTHRGVMALRRLFEDWND